jgi:hypothetical protein
LAANHIIIGLGGTGGKVIAAMRRLMFQHHGSSEPRSIALDYLYVDTSKRETDLARQGQGLASNDKRWRYLGHSVQLAPSQVVHLSNSSFGTIVKNSEDYPHIASWLGDASVWNRYWDNQKGEMEAAGQIRRFGRIVLAQNYEAARLGLQDRMNALRTKNNSTEWRFHIVAGLAGGTGSGSFLDIVRLVNDAARGLSSQICLYTILPEAEETKWSKGNYHANGYAALAELNAMQVGRLELTNLRPGGDISVAPVKCSWLITNKNKNGVRVDVQKTLPNLTAEALYQIYVASGEASIGNGGPAANTEVRLDVATGENPPTPDHHYEKDDPENPKLAPFDRFNRFISFGINTIAVPVEEVQEFSSFIFLRQFLLQSLNNSWVQGSGFSDAPRKLDHAAIAKKDDMLERWLFTNKHLKLETGSMPNDDNWRSLKDEFAKGINGKANEIQAVVKDSAAWPRSIEDHARDFYENGFRRSGVTKFYAGADRSREDRAKLIVHDRIARDLFDRWLSGDYSVCNVVEIIREIQHQTEARRKECDESVAKFTRTEEELAKSSSAMKQEYTKLNTITFALKGKKLFSQFVENLIELQTARSQRAAFGYAASLLSTVMQELEKLRADADVMKQRLEEALEEIDVALANRVQVGNDQDAGTGQYKFYKPEKVRSLLSQLEANEKVQAEQASALRAKIAEAVGSEPSFRGFSEKIPASMIVSILEEESTNQALNAIEAVEVVADRILDGSIVEGLYREYRNNNEGLAAFIAGRVNDAQPLVMIDNSEINKPGTFPLLYSTVAFVPSRESCPDYLTGFHDDLVQAIRGAGQSVEIVETSGQPERIVVMSFLSEFPLRLVSDLKFLKEFYDRKMQGGDESNLGAMMLHLEGDGSNLPRLYSAGVSDYRKQAEPFWMIAQAMGLLKDAVNPDTGRNQAVFQYQDHASFGDIETLDFGSSVADGLAGLSMGNAIVLMRVVKDELSRVVHVDKKKQLALALGEFRDKALKDAGGNALSAKFKEVDQRVKVARALVMS